MHTQWFQLPTLPIISPCSLEDALSRLSSTRLQRNKPLPVRPFLPYAYCQRLLSRSLLDS